MIRKVLMAAINADHPQTGMFYGLEQVFGKGNVVDYDFLEMKRRGMPGKAINDGLVEAAVSNDVDWVWLQVQETGVLDPRIIRRIKERLPRCTMSHWTGDLRTTIGENMAGFCRETDVTFASSVGQLPFFRAAGARRTEYLQIGLDYSEDILGIPEWTPPFPVRSVMFMGHYYGDVFPGTKERRDGIDALMRAGIDVGIVGGGWPSGYPVVGQCAVKQQTHVWRRAKVCLNINNFNQVISYFSDRQIIAMASGKPLVCHYVPDLEETFQNGVHCLWYWNTDQLVACVRRLLADRALAAQIGEAGKKEVIERHTWEARFRKILPIIEQEASRMPS